MKHWLSLPRMVSRSKIGHLRFGSASQARRRETAQLISLLRPLIVMFLASLGSAVVLNVALRQAISSGCMPWAMLVLGAAHAVASFGGFIIWKRVAARRSAFGAMVAPMASNGRCSNQPELEKRKERYGKEK